MSKTKKQPLTGLPKAIKPPVTQKSDASEMPNIETIPVNSSNLAEIGWDKDHLVVKFKSGKHFVYDGVSKETFDEMRQAESVGGYFAQKIKGKYPETGLSLQPASEGENNGNTDGNTEDQGSVSEQVGSLGDNETAIENEPDHHPDHATGQTSDAGTADIGRSTGLGNGTDETEGSTDSSSDAPEPSHSGIESRTEQWNRILSHFGAERFHLIGKTEYGADVFVVFTIPCEGALPVEIAQGTFLELHNAALDGTDPEAFKPKPCSDMTTEQERGRNLKRLKQQVEAYGIGLQIERAKADVDHWNLTASISTVDSTRSHSFRINENATEEECKTAHDEIIAAFIVK